MKIEETNLGYEIRLPEYTILFGGKNAQMDAIRSAYPHVDFVRVKQIHSDGVVESENSALDAQIVADAHFTRQAQLGICVITADCIPVFLIDPTTQLIAGAHAGWRGVANRIVPKTIAHMHAKGARSQELHVFIGPHIQKNSFEVGYDVRDQILTSLHLQQTGPTDLVEDMGNQKALVDLHQALKEQLLQEGISGEHVHSLYLDTFTNPLFHSHRRDKENAGRQVSFVYRHE